MAKKLIYLNISANERTTEEEQAGILDPNDGHLDSITELADGSYMDKGQRWFYTVPERIIGLTDIGTKLVQNKETEFDGIFLDVPEKIEPGLFKAFTEAGIPVIKCLSEI